MSMMKYWVWLSRLTRLRPRTRSLLLEHFGTPEEIFFAPEGAYSELPEVTPEEAEILKDKDLSQVYEILARCDGAGIQILTVQDAAYPQRLQNIYDPPVVLYIRGRIPVVDEEVPVAIVGTRKATPYGIKMARTIGYEIAKCGGLVVSGLAAGVDSAGAQGALQAGGKCIGVLGTAIDEVYPRFNRPLFDDVAASGALVSEYPPGVQGNRAFFPQRNRLIAGLSLGVVIIEAPARSGALITAGLAAEQGRDVFVVPGNADAANCVGSNALIKEGAKAVTSGWDILSEYTGLYPHKLHQRTGVPPAAPEPLPTQTPASGRETGEGFVKLREPVKKKAAPAPAAEAEDAEGLEAQLAALSPQQLQIVSAMDVPEKHVDDIAEAAGLPIHVVLGELTLLQIQGYVTQEAGKRFTLNVKKGFLQEQK